MMNLLVVDFTILTHITECRREIVKLSLGISEVDYLSYGNTVLLVKYLVDPNKFPTVVL
jgi:hypothetical protein